jgi:quercetin dioxygenase-like cupin family protein
LICQQKIYKLIRLNKNQFMEKSAFIAAHKLPVEDLGEGVSRQILGYDKNIMMVKVSFEKGAIGKAHRHPPSSPDIICGFWCFRSKRWGQH